MADTAILAGSMEIPLSLIDVRVMKAALTISYKTMGDDEPRMIELFRMTATSIHVPRQYGIEFCEKNRIDYEDRTSQGVEIKFKKIPALRDYQVGPLKEIEDCFQQHYDFMFRARTGWGKCQAAGTPILMYDGTIKKVEKVVVGDLLMGPDSAPRRVLSLARGREEMFRVTPKKGEAHTFNRSHVLSLKATGAAGAWSKGDIVNVSIDEYLQWSPKRKHLFKLWRTGVDFSPSGHVLPYAPYFVGLYLGDGTKRVNVQMHVGNDRTEAHAYIRRFADSHGIALREAQAPGCRSFVFAKRDNVEFINFIQRDLLTCSAERKIPHEYLTASREDRLQLLAGLMDTDGHLYGNCYELIAKDQGFAEQVCFLARSLGLAAYMSPSQKRAQGWAETRIYYRVKISGHTDMVPVLTPSRRAAPRQQKKDALVTGFDIQSVGEGEYYGFTLDGDHLYLLGDFTATHNTIGALLVAAKLGVSTLVVVDQENLKDQWIEVLIKHFGCARDDIGIIQGDKCIYKDKPVTIAMVQTLTQRIYPKEVLEYFGFMLLDELHIFAAPTFWTILLKFTATYRLGVSATPKRRDALQKALEYNLGRVRVYVADEHEESSVYMVEHKTIYTAYANMCPKIGRFLTEISEDGARNLQLAKVIKHLYDLGHNTLVLSDRIEQLKHLKSLCYYLGIPEVEAGLYTGCTPYYMYEKDTKPLHRPQGWVKGTQYTPIRLNLVSKRNIKKEVMEEIKTKARIIYATYGKFSKGVDEPRLSAGVDASPRSRSEQVQGRILRKVEGKMRPIWVTTADTCSYRSLFGLAARISDYVKSNSVIYKWSLEGGKTKCNTTDLKQDLGQEIQRLQAMKIGTDSHGLNTLTTRLQAITIEMRRGRDIITGLAPRRNSPTDYSQKEKYGR